MLRLQQLAAACLAQLLLLLASLQLLLQLVVACSVLRQPQPLVVACLEVLPLPAPLVAVAYSVQHRAQGQHPPHLAVACLVAQAHRRRRLLVAPACSAARLLEAWVAAWVQAWAQAW